MRSWTLTIPRIFPTTNVYLRTPRLRKGKRRSRSTRYQNDMIHDWSVFLLEAGVRDIPHAKKRRRVTIDRHSPGLQPDQPNLYTPADKLILDNLVRQGVLVDDNMTWLELGPIRPVHSKETKTVILIEEIA